MQCCYGVFCPFAECRNTHPHSAPDLSQAVLFVTQYLPEEYLDLLEAFDRHFKGNQAAIEALDTYSDQSQRRYVRTPTLAFHRPRLVALALCAGNPALHGKIGAFLKDDAQATRRNVSALRQANELKELYKVLTAPAPPVPSLDAFPPLDTVPPVDSILDSDLDTVPPLDTVLDSVRDALPRLEAFPSLEASSVASPSLVQEARRECILCFDDLHSSYWVMLHAEGEEAHGGICDACKDTALRTRTTCHVCDKPLCAAKPLLRVILL